MPDLFTVKRPFFEKTIFTARQNLNNIPNQLQ